MFVLLNASLALLGACQSPRASESAQLKPSDDRLVYASTSLFRDVQSLLRFALGSEVEMSMEASAAGPKTESVTIEGTLIGWSSRKYFVPRKSGRTNKLGGTMPRFDWSGKVLGTYRYEARFSSQDARPARVRLSLEVDPRTLAHLSLRPADAKEMGALLVAIRDGSAQSVRFHDIEVSLGKGGSGSRSAEFEVEWPPKFVKTTAAERRPLEMMAYIEDARKIAPFLNERVLSGARVLFAPPTNYMEHLPIWEAPGWLVSGSEVIGPAQLFRRMVGAVARLQKSVGFQGCPEVERFYKKGLIPSEGVRLAGNGLAVEVKLNRRDRTPQFIFSDAPQAGPSAAD